MRELLPRAGECLVEGCARLRKSAGYCGTHYWRLRAHGDPGPAEIRAPRPAECVLEGCSRTPVGRGLCRMHYERQRKGKEVGDSAPLRRARGEGTVANGYRIITVGGRSCMEHRVLMEQLLGRPLLRHETVHHLNGDRSDNTVAGPLDGDFRSGNLQLWSTWQPAGQRVRDKVAWAQALLSQYAPDLLADPRPGD